MEQHLSPALLVVLYVASLALVVGVLMLLGALLQFRKQLERIVGAVEELNAELKPLARESRAVVARLGHLSARADHLAEEIGAVVEPPIVALSHGLGRLRRGLGVFVDVLLNRNRNHQPKARES